MTDKPKVPITVYALALVALVGLAAQFLAARAAFALVARDPLHPWFAALLIEAAVVVDALAGARTRNEIALGGLILALVVSGIYNYSTAHSVAPGLHSIVKSALAVGPVLALASIGLALGEEIWRYEEALGAWEQAAAEEQAQVDAEERAFDKEQEALDREFERKERRRTRLARQRLERDQAMAGQMTGGWTGGRTVTGQMSDGRPGGRHWPDKDAFLSDDDRPHDLTAGQLSEMAGVSGRTARRWLAEARSSNGKEPMER